MAAGTLNQRSTSSVRTGVPESTGKLALVIVQVGPAVFSVQGVSAVLPVAAL